MVVKSSRFISKRIVDNIQAGINVLEREPEPEYREAARDTAEWWSRRILASGRGGSHNRQMASIETRVSKTGKGWSIRVGWLGNPPIAADGKTSWFVYQDTGYQLFGGSRYIAGLMLQMDAREKLEKNIRDANERIAAKAERAVGSGR